MTAPSYVSIDGHPLDFILDFERANKKVAFLPEWINQTEAVDSYMWSKMLLQLEYTYRATHQEKWDMDTSLRNHTKVSLEDYVHNLFSTVSGGVWIANIDCQWDPTNSEKPWKYKVKLLAMNDEVEGRSTPVTFDSAYYGPPDHIGDHLGHFLIDGEDDHEMDGVNPWSDTLDYGMHDVYFTCPSGQKFDHWEVSGNSDIEDENNDRKVAACTIFIYGDSVVVTAFYVLDPITVTIPDSYNMDAPEYDRGRGDAEVYVQGSWNKIADEIVPPYEESDYGYGLYAIRFDPNTFPDDYDPDVLGYPYLFDHWETEGPAFDMEETTTDDYGREMEIYDFDSSVRLTPVYKNNTDFVSVEFHSKNMTEDSMESDVGRMFFEYGTADQYSIDFKGFSPFAWSLSIGDHIISFNSSRKLIKWVVAGGVTVDDETAQITTLHVTGAGWVCACFLPAVIFDANIHPVMGGSGSFYDGFENWNEMGWLLGAVEGDNVDETTIVYAGSHSRHLSMQGSTNYSVMEQDNDPLIEIVDGQHGITTVHFYIPSSLDDALIETDDPVSSNNWVAFAVFQPQELWSGSLWFWIWKDMDGQPWILFSTPSMTGGDGDGYLRKAMPLTYDTWHEISVDIYVSSIDGYVSISLDGDEKEHDSGSEFMYSSIHIWLPLDLLLYAQYINDGVQLDIYFDEVNVTGGVSTPILTVEGVDYFSLPQKFALRDYPDGLDFEWVETFGSYSWLSCSGLSTNRAGTTEAGRSGTVFATYGVPSTVNLDSSNGEASLGAIEINDSPHSLPDSVALGNGDYAIQFDEPDGYVFDHWNVSDGVSVLSPTSNPTTMTVSGNGNLTAIYVPATHDIDLSASPSNIGTITIDGSVKSLPSTASETEGAHTITYTPSGGFAFDHWEVSGGVSVDHPTQQTASMTVSADGTLGVIYIPLLRNIGLSSQGAGQTNQGTIVIDSKSPFSLPTSDSEIDGIYSCLFNSPYPFYYWEVSGGVSVDNPTNNPANITVTGNGTLKAHYYKGEQFLNGGFETGAFLPYWVTSGSPSISTTSPHSGTYCARFLAGSSFNDTLRQTFAAPMLASDIILFGFYYRNAGTYGRLEIDLYTSEGPILYYFQESGLSTAWQYTDIAAKIISRGWGAYHIIAIRVKRDLYDVTMYVDDFTCLA